MSALCVLTMEKLRYLFYCQQACKNQASETDIHNESQYDTAIFTFFHHCFTKLCENENNDKDSTEEASSGSEMVTGTPAKEFLRNSISVRNSNKALHDFETGCSYSILWKCNHRLGIGGKKS